MALLCLPRDLSFCHPAAHLPALKVTRGANVRVVVVSRVREHEVDVVLPQVCMFGMYVYGICMYMYENMRSMWWCRKGHA